MDDNREIQIKDFMKNKLDIDIGDEFIEDYDQALTHYIDDRPKGTREPERLAFLGDSYLELIIRRYLINNKDNYSLCVMNDLKKPLVSNKNGWKKISKEIGLDEQIITDKHHRRFQDKIQDTNILARSFEALAGVLSYDSSLNDVESKMIDLFIKFGYLPRS